MPDTYAKVMALLEDLDAFSDRNMQSIATERAISQAHRVAALELGLPRRFAAADAMAGACVDAVHPQE